MKILFVCWSNIGRSQVAMSFYNHLTGTNGASSAGTEVEMPGETHEVRKKRRGGTFVIKAMDEDENAFYNLSYFYWKAHFNPKCSPPHFLNSINQNTINEDGFLLKVSKCQSSSLVSSNPTICPNSVIDLHASGGTSYLWKGPNNFTSNQQNPKIQDATSANAGTYICTISGTGGCDGNYSVDIHVEDITAPIPPVSNLPTINGNCKTLVANITKAD